MKPSIIVTIFFIQSLIYCPTVLTDSLSDIKPVDLKTEYLVNPLAIDVQQPRLQWSLVATNTSKQGLSQKAYQILVATDKESLAKQIGNLWDTKKVVSSQTNHIKYGGKPLQSGQRAYWTVYVWNQNDQPIRSSPIQYWDKGMDIGDWTGQWVGAPKDTQHKALTNMSDIDAKVIQDHQGLVPVLYLRKTFNTQSKVISAKLYATAQGSYEIKINGQSVTDSLMNPGWTDYRKTIQYQAYDVTKSIQTKNAISVLLGTGWYSSYVGGKHGYNLYGTDQNLLAELHLEYEDGKTEIIKTDSTWKVSTGGIMYSDLLMGELYYQNRDLPDQWLTVDYDDSHWASVVTKPINKAVELVASRAEPVRVEMHLMPKMLYESKPGVWVFDFEQNMVGWVGIKFPKSHDTCRVQIRHAEVLNPDGSIYTANLRTALATDTYVLNKSENTEIVLTPHFTTHGFRYVEITGYPGKPDLTTIVGHVMHSDTAFTSHFETSNTMVNKLFSNINWGQRGNFLSVPTDCPQRDERLGWMGDAEIFAQTATFNADVAAFYTKWMRDVRDGQSPEGGYAELSPREMPSGPDGAPAWGDAGVIVPYTVYRMYGDTQIIQDNWDAMTKWIDYIESQNPSYLWTKRVNSNFGDWLQVNANTPKEVMNTAYYGYDALLMAKMAKAIGKSNDERRYRELHQHIANAFVKEFVNTTDGRIRGDTQTDYVLALAMDMLPENLRSLAGNHLAENIKAHDWHLTTGFIGVGYLCPTLSQLGHTDVAYRLLLQDTYPSWGYSIQYNATTIWERWDGWTKEKGFQDPGMNSFNHYSLGSVGRWLWQTVAGIDTDDTNVGFKKIKIAPKPGGGLKSLKAMYPSISGQISTSWVTDGVNVTLTVKIPVNTKADIDLTFMKSGQVKLDVGSGTYVFKGELAQHY